MKEKFNKKLLVEGIDDQHVLFALCQKFNIKESFDIIDCKGIDNLLEQIPFRFKNGNDTIGIIIDADVNLESQFLRLKKIVESLGFKVPDKLPIDGFINLNENNNKVGIWIMPNNQVAGMLEDFITFLVPKDDKLLPIVDETLNAIENQEKNKYKYIHKAKARIHTWLSWQEDPGTPMGLSITKKYLTTEDENCKIFMNWIDKVFNN